MKQILIIFSILLFNSVYSQSKLIIIDGITKTPLPYATLKLLNKKEIYITNENGFIQFDLPKPDTILITYVGYKSLNYIIFIDITDTIQLFTKGSTLPDFISKKLIPIGKSIKIGLHKYKKNRRFKGFGYHTPNFPGTEIATYLELPNENEQYKLLKIILPTNKIEKNDPLRLHIYSINEDGEPFEDLMNEDVIMDQGSNLIGNIELDVSNQNIILNGRGVFAGIQWIGLGNKIGNNTKVLFTYDYNKSVTFLTHLNFINKKWEKFGMGEKFNPNTNLTIGLVIQRLN